MSKSQIFGPQNGPAPNFLRNAYDKSFQNLITTDFGELRPCFCKEVLPGDSIRIDPAVVVRSHPIVFPINTRIKFYCYFFYGRNRILYKDFEDFIWGTKDGLVPPLLKLSNERAKKMISTGSLGDNLGVPSTIATSSIANQVKVIPRSTTYLNGSASSGSDVFSFLQSSLENLKSLVEGNYPITSSSGAKAVSYRLGLFTSPVDGKGKDLDTLPFDVVDHQVTKGAFAVFTNSNSVPISAPLPIGITVISRGTDKFIRYSLEDDGPLGWYELSDLMNSKQRSGYYIYIVNDNRSAVPQTFFPVPNSTVDIPISIPIRRYYANIVDATDDEFIGLNKFVGNNPQIPLSALPFRLYEFCCNYFFRNDQNNPYVLNGEAQYNKFIPSTDGGWDTNEYVIHHRNWEMDAYTSAVPSPQYGTAPLVGLTYSGGDTATVNVDVTDSDGNTQQLGIQVGVDKDGNINSILHADEGVPSGSLRRLMDGTDGIQLGMSINDFRNVNAFQRFKENVLRRDLRYRNQLLSHMGVSVDYPDIDIPQFIGGFSGDLIIREVTNMAESADVALGDVAGKIDATLSSKHTISCYCPEHGFIMGIFSIVPVPTYSQLLPKMFTRYNYLDYFQQEFGKIGYVPITHREFLPLQSSDPDTVLGYQRAFYEYMFSADEVHGDFRTTLDDFVLYRQYSEVPTLNEDFVTVNADSLNNIFAVDKVEDKYKNSAKFMCSFFFDVSHKMQIPKFGTPSLE